MALAAYMAKRLNANREGGTISEMAIHDPQPRMKVSDANTTAMSSLEKEVRRAAGTAMSLESAAQRFSELVYSRFGESLVLARLYVTLPLRVLADRERRFVETLVSNAALSEDVPVLTLLGTCGADPSWNDRRQSKGHVGIPLKDARFVQAIPMVSALLGSMGVDVGTLDSSRDELMRELVGGFNGVFYVPDAQSAVDAQGRKIIPAQDFVEAHSVRTVFGLGGAYLNSTSFMVCIFFCKEAVSKKIAESFAPLASSFKIATGEHVRTGRLFA